MFLKLIVDPTLNCVRVYACVKLACVLFSAVFFKLDVTEIYVKSIL
jgi:hypothetical protein